MVRDTFSSYKIDYVIELSKSQRASKLDQWFKSNGHLTEGVDFAYWCSYFGKSLRLYPAQQACFLSSVIHIFG